MEGPTPGTAEFEANFPTQAELSQDPELNRAMGAREHASMQRMSDSLAAQAVEHAKWFLTTLLAVNSGGAIAAGQLHIRPGFQVAAGSLFVLGMVLALITSVVAIGNIETLSKTVGRYIAYWNIVEVKGARNREFELQMAVTSQKLIPGKIWTRGLMLGSLLVFIAGCLVVGRGLWLALPS